MLVNVCRYIIGPNGSGYTYGISITLKDNRKIIISQDGKDVTAAARMTEEANYEGCFKVNCPY